MIRKCEYENCGIEFEGTPQSHYCPEHRLLLQREAHRRWELKNKDRKRKNQRAYYQRNREKIIAKQRVRNKANYEYKRGPIERDFTGWKIEYLRKGDLWTWKAIKGNVTLEAHRNFYSLRTAQKDCMLAIG